MSEEPNFLQLRPVLVLKDGSPLEVMSHIHTVDDDVVDVGSLSIILVSVVWWLRARR